jgi:hypothetical protein
MNNQEWRYSIAHGLSKQSRISFNRISRALGVEIKDLFECAHLQAYAIKVEEIDRLLVSADEEEKRMIMKIVRAVVR